MVGQVIIYYMEIKLSTNNDIFKLGNLLDFKFNDQNFDIHNCFEIIKTEITNNELIIILQSNELYNEMNSVNRKVIINIEFQNVVFDKDFCKSNFNSFTYFVVSSENDKFRHNYKKKYAIDLIFNGDDFLLLYCDDIIFRIKNK